MSVKRAKVDKTFAALSDPSRRRVVELLRQKSYRAGEIAEMLKLAPPALSRHLKTLRDSGLVEETHPEFDARVRIYSLKAGALIELRQWVDDTEKMSAGQAAKPRPVAPKRK